MLASALQTVEAPAPGRGLEGSTLHYCTFSTPIGTLSVAYQGLTVRCANLDVAADLFVADCQARLGWPPTLAAEPPARLGDAIEALFAGKERYRGPLDLSSVSEFQRRALLKALEIRKGEVRPYSWLAREIDAPGAARAVGTAMAQNPIPILIPCHRVVRADYQIGQYGCGGPAKKREILRYEGVDVDDLERLGRQGIRFQGSKTTRIFCLPGCYTGRHMATANRVLFASAAEARAAGFRPCKVCRPAGVADG